ncbi:MAG: tRNA 4-thiouridine(8) synthase ThiI [Deltaproteobacteria bacterium]|nr:tRNA 4-thiouridine(8) synthase ThiI [Deltaproteobacteria bacterium]
MAIYLLRYTSELSLKGKNRSLFENKLLNNIKALFGPSEIEIKKEHRRAYILSDLSSAMIHSKLSCIAGLSSWSEILVSELDIESICRTVENFVCRREAFEEGRGDPISHLDQKKDCFDLRGKSRNDTCIRFSIQARRANKKFPLTSPEINRYVGKHIAEKFPQLIGDYKNPDFSIRIEIQEHQACIYENIERGMGGLPVGTGAKLVSLLSGGIDSPVASWMMMRRGSPIIFATFHSPPFLEEEGIEKILTLAKHLSRYQPKTKIYKVFFTEIQKSIKLNTHDRYRTILYRRFMHRVAEKIAQKENAQALITGESLGQVASQTLENLTCIGNATSLPVLRPLIGLEKEEIIERAKKIGTYEISIQPYSDCCTLFAPQNPTTKASLDRILEEEKKLDVENLVSDAFEKTEVITIGSLL